MVCDGVKAAELLFLSLERLFMTDRNVLYRDTAPLSGHCQHYTLDVYRITRHELLKEPITCIF